MSIYYVSNLGNDANDGLTPETAWQTIKKVNATIKGGDEVRFRKGEIFYGSLRAPHGISETQQTTYTSYGEGEKPVVSQYKITKPGKWEKHEEGVYKFDLTNTDNYTGNTIDINANVGFMKFGGKIYAAKKFLYEEIQKQWDFYCDDTYVYVKSDKCPCEYSQEIKLACSIYCMRFVPFVRVEGINFTGTGAHGIQGVTEGSYIGNCEFHEIGGSRLLEDVYLPNGKLNRVRHGNGVETWANSANVTVENCKFSDIYDVATSIQGWKVVRNWENIIFRNNVIWDCAQAFEIWTSGEIPNMGIVNCRFENNVCINSGYGWGAESRPDKDQSCHLLVYHLDCDLCDITITGNVFSNARNSTLFKSFGVEKLPEDYKIYGNTIIRKPGQPIAFQFGAETEHDKAFEEKICRDNRVFDILE